MKYVNVKFFRMHTNRQFSFFNQFITRFIPLKYFDQVCFPHFPSYTISYVYVCFQVMRFVDVSMVTVCRIFYRPSSYYILPIFYRPSPCLHSFNILLSVLVCLSVALCVSVCVSVPVWLTEFDYVCDWVSVCDFV